MFQEYFTESLTEKIIIKVFYWFPGKIIAGSAFRDKSMDMRVPFEVAAEGVEHTDKTGSKVFAFIHFRKHTQDDISDRVE